jgi:hypothetical protein
VTAIALYLLLIPLGWAVYRITAWWLDRKRRRGRNSGA